MDFMGIGPFELLLVLIIGFLLLGPEKLPEMAAKAGRLYRNLKRATFDLSKTITEDVSSEKKTISEDLSTEKKTLSEDLSSLSRTIAEDLYPENKAENTSKKASGSRSDEKVNVGKAQETTLPSQPDDNLDER